MAEFITQLNMRCDCDNKWEILTPFIYTSDILPDQVIVKPGFTCDLASVPRLPFAYWFAGGTADKAAVLHDWLYWTGPCTRKQADGVFLEAMKVSGISTWRRYPMYWAVRVGAGFKWDEYRKRNGTA